MNNVNNSKSSGKFQDFVNAQAVVCHSCAAASEAVIDELIALIAAGNPAIDPAEVRRSVLEREAMFPTVIAPGLAMPHARVNGLDELVVALATSADGISFGSEDEKVRVVVLVLSPVDNPGLHLQVVSALAREFSDPGKIDQLADLASVDEVMKFLGIVPMRLSEYLKVGDLAGGVGPVVLPDDSLAFALRKFAEGSTCQLPVLDEAGAVLGVITLKDILNYNLPAGLLEKDDLSEIYDFRPYAKMLGKAGEIKVSELMRCDCLKVCEELPAVQLVKLFLTRPDSEVLVVDEAGHLRGEIRLRDFCAKLLWE
ncbi:MAG: CBS domain-containing protein [Lentisphaerae bacterium]|nr:CBS domain-containing protein [Lentisphaerota bacterium]